VYSEVLEVVRGVYDVRADDAALRRAAEMDPVEAAAEFARLRTEYRVRREFASCEIDAAGLSPHAAAILGALGFILV
jgi:erythronate-4-phosphate dehydrogenase